MYKKKTIIDFRIYLFLLSNSIVLHLNRSKRQHVLLWSRKNNNSQVLNILKFLLGEKNYCLFWIYEILLAKIKKNVEIFRFNFKCEKSKKNSLPPSFLPGSRNLQVAILTKQFFLRMANWKIFFIMNKKDTDKVTEINNNWL